MLGDMNINGLGMKALKETLSPFEAARLNATIVQFEKLQNMVKVNATVMQIEKLQNIAKLKSTVVQAEKLQKLGKLAVPSALIQLNEDPSFLSAFKAAQVVPYQSPLAQAVRYQFPLAQAVRYQFPLAFKATNIGLPQNLAIKEIAKFSQSLTSAIASAAAVNPSILKSMTDTISVASIRPIVVHLDKLLVDAKGFDFKDLADFNVEALRKRMTETDFSETQDFEAAINELNTAANKVEGWEHLTLSQRISHLLELSKKYYVITFILYWIIEQSCSYAFQNGLDATVDSMSAKPNQTIVELNNSFNSDSVVHKDQGLITARTAVMKTNKKRATRAGILQPGIEVTIYEKRRKWVLVGWNNDGARCEGWVRSKSVQRILDRP